MKCPQCNNELLWEGDDDYEDFLIEDKEGIVSNNTCTNEECDVDLVLIYTEI